MPESKTPPQPVNYAEKRNHTFDFTADMTAGGSTSIASVNSLILEVSPISQTPDPSPSSHLNGSGQITGMTVIVSIGPGLVVGCRYKRECWITANDGQIYHQSWEFPCSA